jgi:hypothetical protein
MLKAERDWELPRIGELPMPAGGLCAPSALQMVFGAMNLKTAFQTTKYTNHTKREPLALQ